MKTFYKLGFNSQKYFVTCCEYGPFTSIEEAMALAAELNRKLAETRKKENKSVVLEWRQKRVLPKVQ